LFRAVNVAVVVGFGIFLVYYLLNQVDIKDIKDAFFGVYMPSLVIGLVLMFSIDYFKAYRSKLLIGSSRIGIGDMFIVSLIRNAFNMVLPARTGELSYVYVLKKKFKIPVEVGISTLMIALVFDLIIIFSMIVISIIIVGINKYAISSVSIILIAAGLLIASLLFLFYLFKLINLFIKFNIGASRYFRRSYEKLLDKEDNIEIIKKRKNGCRAVFLLIAVKVAIFFLRVFIKAGRNKGAQYIYKKLVDTNKNIEIIQKRKIYWKVYLLSVATRVLKFTSYYFLIHAVLKPMGYGFGDLNYWVIFLATVAAELSAVLPTHALAGLGTYEGAFALTFVMLGFSKKISIIVGFNYHIINLIFTVIMGLMAMAILSMPFYKMKNYKTLV